MPPRFTTAARKSNTSSGLSHTMRQAFVRITYITPALPGLGLDTFFGMVCRVLERLCRPVAVNLALRRSTMVVSLAVRELFCLTVLNVMVWFRIGYRSRARVPAWMRGNIGPCDVFYPTTKSVDPSSAVPGSWSIDLPI